MNEVMEALSKAMDNIIKMLTIIALLIQIWSGLNDK